MDQRQIRKWNRKYRRAKRRAEKHIQATKKNLEIMQKANDELEKIVEAGNESVKS